MALPKPEESSLSGGGFQFESLDTIERRNNDTDENYEPDIVDSDDADSVIKSNVPETKNSKSEDDSKVNPDSFVVSDDSQKKFKPLEDISESDDKTPDDDNNNDEEEGDVVERDVVEDENDDDSENDSEEFSVTDTFNFLKESNVLMLPENFEFKGTEESFEEALTLDSEMRNTAVMQNIESQIKDNRIFEMIEMGIKGGEFADMEKLFAATKEQAELEQYDVNKPEDAKEILKLYYKEAKFNDTITKRNINRAEQEETLEEEADEALKYLQERKTEVKEKLNKQASEQKKLKEIQQQEFNTNVVKVIQSGEYSKDQVMNLATLLSPAVNKNTKEPLKNKVGDSMNYYEYRLQQIQNNPEHLVQLLNILSMYDDNNGFNKQKEKEVKQKETQSNKRSFDLLNKLQQQRKGKGSPMPGGKSKFIPKQSLMPETD
jgi:hypothetical protein